MLSGALTYRSTGSCPAATPAQAKTALDVAQRKGVADAAGLSIKDSPIYQLEMSYRQTAIRDTPPTIVGKDAR